MCLAILQPAGKVVPQNNIREGWISNPDGGGYGFVDAKGELVIRKGFFKLKEYADSYQQDVNDNKDSPFLLHFRIATMGTKGPENTHPFAIEDGILIHNGTLSGTGAVYNVGKSDTALFAELFSKDLSFNFVHKHKTELNASLDYNKVAILYKDKRWSIINEAIGVWDDNIWYSNRTYITSCSSHSSYWQDGDWEND